MTDLEGASRQYAFIKKTQKQAFHWSASNNYLRADFPGGHPALGQNLLGGTCRGGETALLHRVSILGVPIFT